MSTVITPPPLSKISLVCALVIGFAADLLVGDGPRGIAFVLWILLIVGMTCLLMRNARIAISRETIFWLISAVLFAGGMALRDAVVLHIFNFMATFFSLVMVAASCSRPRSLLFASPTNDVIKAFGSICLSMVTGISVLGAEVAKSRSTQAEKSPKRLLRASIFAIMIFLIFFALLRTADPIFASFTKLPAFDLGAIIRHIAMIIACSAAICGAIHAALTSKLAVDKNDASPHFQLHRLEVFLAFGALNILFASFVLTQLGFLFGGEDFLRERTGLTVAEYARYGFFQMLTTVALMIPVLLVSRSLIVPSVALRRLHTFLALPIIILLSIMILSSAMKMRLYVSYFGLSTDRLYATFFLLWLSMVLIWLALTVLQDRSTLFPSGAILSALAIIFMMNIFVPDRLVAKINCARANNQTSSPVALDINYLANLSADAVDISVQALLTAWPTTPQQKENRCAAAKILLERFNNKNVRSWRWWNAAEARARRIVHSNSDELSDTCI